MIRITSKRDGFRRCGLAHGKEPAEYPDDFFPDAQMEVLRKEPMLVVQEGLADDGVLAESKAPDKMTMPELKALLDKLKVDYPANAKKTELVELVLANTDDPPQE
jgi:hypothetical protein